MRPTMCLATRACGHPDVTIANLANHGWKSKMKMTVLKATSVRYFSSIDEDLFFAWIGRIRCIESYHGVGEELLIEIDADKVGPEELSELIALFLRYKVNLSQLAEFANGEQKTWLQEQNK